QGTGGSYALEIAPGSSTGAFYEVGVTSPLKSVTAGNLYLLSANMRTNSGSPLAGLHTGYAKVSFYDSSNNYLGSFINAWDVTRRDTTFHRLERPISISSTVAKVKIT